MTTLSLPSLPSIDRAVAELLKTADAKTAKQIVKAQYALHRGIEIVATTDGALLIPGSTGTVHRLTAMGVCSCPSTTKCYHAYISTILELAHARPCGDDVPGDGAPPGDSEPGIGGGEGGNLPPDRPRQINPALVIHLLRERRGLTMPDLRRKKALAEMNELF